MKSIHARFVIIITLVFLAVIGCLVPIAKAQLPDSWLNLDITSFNGDNISFNLQITVRGNHIADNIGIQVEPTSGNGVVITVYRGINNKVYSQDTNLTVFNFDYSYQVSSPFYEAGPKLFTLLLFPADSYILTLNFESSFNLTVDTHPTACQLPSQNYQGSFAVTQTASDAFTVNVLINHSGSFFWGVLIFLLTTLVSLYGLSFYLIAFTALVYLKKKSRRSLSNIATVSSAIIFFVPAFEIAFYSLKSPLPLVFSDILMFALIPLNAIIIAFALGRQKS
jgi:hypothetical protein